MKKLRKLILLAFLILVLSVPTLAQDPNVTVYFGKQEEELIYNEDYIMKNNHIYVQVKRITPVLPFIVPGKGFSWNDQDQGKKLTIFHTDEEGLLVPRVIIKAGESKFQDLDKKLDMNRPAVLSNGRMFVPIRGLSQAYNKQVTWEKENGKQKVYIGGSGKEQEISQSEKITDFSLNIFSESFEGDNVLI